MSGCPDAAAPGAPTRPARRALLRWAGLLALPPLPALAGIGPADTAPLHAIAGPDSAQQRAIVDALGARFPRLAVDQDVARLRALGRPLACLALGPQALDLGLRARLEAPLISLLCSRQAFARALAAHAVADRPNGSRRVTAIHAESSPAQQLRLVAALYRRTVTVGVLVSEQSESLVPLLTDAAREHRLDLAVERADAGISLSRQLSRLASATVILIFPDASLFTPTSLRELLETTYRRRQPVIGFSEGLVRAGTLASAYAGIDDTVAQLRETVAALAAGSLPPPQYPRYWRVAVNDSVARSLDVVVDEAVLRLGDRP